MPKEVIKRLQLCVDAHVSARPDLPTFSWSHVHRAVHADGPPKMGVKVQRQSQS